MVDDEKLFEKVILLGILTRSEGESIDDTIEALVATGMFDIQEARGYLDQLKKDGLVTDSGLTMMGVEIAKKAQEEFAKAGEEMRVQ